MGGPEMTAANPPRIFMQRVGVGSDSRLESN